MRNPYFQFKQCTVFHDRCAMEVGTDAVLMGAWCKVGSARKIADIGCGSGIISRMMAQRSTAQITGIEIDEQAALQAQENVSRSPWGSRIEIVTADIKSFAKNSLFDAIVSNPPYFVESLKCPDKQRSTARHTDELNFEELFACVDGMLSPEGEFSLIVPIEAATAIKSIALSHLLFLTRETIVYAKPDKAPKRILLAFSHKQPDFPEISPLIITEQSGELNQRYREMVSDFYLRL